MGDEARARLGQRESCWESNLIGLGAQGPLGAMEKEELGSKYIITVRFLPESSRRADWPGQRPLSPQRLLSHQPRPLEGVRASPARAQGGLLCCLKPKSGWPWNASGEPGFRAVDLHWHGNLEGLPLDWQWLEAESKMKRWMQAGV